MVNNNDEWARLLAYHAVKADLEEEDVTVDEATRAQACTNGWGLRALARCWVAWRTHSRNPHHGRKDGL